MIRFFAFRIPTQSRNGLDNLSQYNYHEATKVSIDDIPGCWKYIGGREVRQTLYDKSGSPSKKYCSTARRSWSTASSLPSVKASALQLCNRSVILDKGG